MGCLVAISERLKSTVSLQRIIDGPKYELISSDRAASVVLQVGRAVKPSLTPIPVARTFDRVGVDIIQFPQSSMQWELLCHIVFVDYLT